MTQTQQAVILLSRGDYSQGPPSQLNNLVVSVQSAKPDTLFVGAVVDKGSPSLPEALQQCAEAGVQRIVVQPVFLPADYNLQRWLAKVIMRWHSRWQGAVVEICLADSLGDHPALQAAVVEVVQSVRPYIRNIPDTPPADWEFDPASWSIIPQHARHVFLCQGPRCTALGADGLAAHLRKRLKEHNMTEQDRVLVAQTGCLYPCNLGPVMVVYPDGVWYGSLTPEAIDQVIEEHFLGGQPVEPYLCPLGPGAL
jgi:(2Fe-2S) ferredoxin